MTVIDRFEGEYAVLETETGMVTLLRKELPENAREGDVLIQNGGKYALSRSKTAERRRKLREKLRKLQNKKEN